MKQGDTTEKKLGASDNADAHTGKLNAALKIIVIVLWLATMILIAYFSSKPADESTLQSHAVGTVICKIVIKDFKTFTQAIRQYYVELVDKFVRKSAHFFEYAVLGILSYAFFNFSLKKIADKLTPANKGITFIKLFLIPVVWSLLYSVTDEIHQYFVDGRYASVTDVLIDTGGAAFGVLLLLLIRLLVIKIRNKKTPK